MNKVLQMTPDTVDQTNYYFFEQGFNKQELQKIERETTKLPLHSATTFGGDLTNTRISRVKWVPQNTQWWWLYEKLNNMAIEANNTLWKFSLSTMPEQIQLSDGDTYEGGDLELFKGGPFPLDTKDRSKTNIDVAPRKAGCVFIFPSFMMHRVAPVTKGTRKSFVLWLGGGHYI